MARSRMARLFPTLPPSASSASAMTAPHERHADIAERRGNRGVRLVDRDAHRAHARKSSKDGIGDPAGGGFDQTKTLAAECLAHTIDHFVKRPGFHDLV